MREDNSGKTKVKDLQIFVSHDDLRCSPKQDVDIDDLNDQMLLSHQRPWHHRSDPELSRSTMMTSTSFDDETDEDSTLILTEDESHERLCSARRSAPFPNKAVRDEQRQSGMGYR